MVDNERPWLNRTRREVETQAKKMLAQGMEYAVCKYNLHDCYSHVILFWWLFMIVVEPHTGGRGCASVSQPGNIGRHCVDNSEGM